MAHPTFGSLLEQHSTLFLLLDHLAIAMVMAGPGNSSMRGVRVAMVVLALGMSMIHAAAQVHHVVGGDRGWDPSSNIASWSIGKAFRIGDNVWFAYSAALESVVELRSREDFESCDVSNPIRMYTGGLDRVSLDGQGSRYFASANPDSCKNGLKLHVHVLPPSFNPTVADIAVAAAGPTPSISAPLPPLSLALFMSVALPLLCCLVVAS